MSDLSAGSLKELLPGRAVRYLETVGSTNTIAMEWASEGAEHGSVVVTDHQTGGRGRWGRSWASQPGRLLQFSVILRPDLPIGELGLIATAVGVSVAVGIEATTNLEPTIKWPNDVHLNGRKVSGNLIETQAAGDRIAVAVAGIGINVGWTSEEVPEEIRERATSLAIEGALVDRATLLASVLESLDRWTGVPSRELIEEATRRSEIVGRRVRIRYPDGRTEVGDAVGFDAAGALLLQTGSAHSVVKLAEVEQVREG